MLSSRLVMASAKRFGLMRVTRFEMAIDAGHPLSLAQLSI